MNESNHAALANLHDVRSLFLHAVQNYKLHVHMLSGASGASCKLGLCSSAGMTFSLCGQMPEGRSACLSVGALLLPNSVVQIWQPQSLFTQAFKLANTVLSPL